MRDPKSDSPQLSGYVQQGQGSGLIFLGKGFILTNAHVVEDANKVLVTLTDDWVFHCQVMGSDKIVDIAVLKMLNVNNGGPPIIANLPVAELGDSDSLSVGKIVIAVGSPGGLDNTVTTGIVSGLEQSSTMVGIPHKKVAYIQTDAAINPGYSGGPLIDVERGKAAIRAHMEGTSFAIPIKRVRDIMADVSEGREIHHGHLGLGLATCTPDWARQNNADSSSGSQA
jgi:S1-C subfamily serine protease